TRSSLGLIATASARSGLATDTRWILTGLSTTSDFPTVTARSLVTRPVVSWGAAPDGPGACSVVGSSASNAGDQTAAESRAIVATHLLIIIFPPRTFAQPCDCRGSFRSRTAGVWVPLWGARQRVEAGQLLPPAWAVLRPWAPLEPSPLAGAPARRTT